METTLELCAPMRWFFFRDTDHEDRTEDTLAELLALDLTPVATTGRFTDATMGALDTLDGVPHFAAKWTPPTALFLRYKFLVLRAHLQFDEKDIADLFSGPDAEQVDRNNRVHIIATTGIADLHKLLCDLALVANIANPGGFSFEHAETFIDTQHYMKEDGAHHMIWDAARDALRLGWPKLKTLPVSDVWRWAQGIPGFTHAAPTTRLGRAISAFSYLLNPNWSDENHLALVWALMGLEALYSRDSVGLKTQLLEKTEALLGPREENKKLFGWMYDFRSRLIHGDYNVPFRHHVYDDRSTRDKFETDLMRSEAMAIATLVATLQYMAEHTIYELGFAYRPIHEG